MKIVIIGAGYVGLVTSACLADFGHKVTCIDVNVDKISALKCGTVPIYEPGLSELISKNAEKGNLFFDTCMLTAIPSAEAVFIAVGTPSKEATGRADLTYIYAVARQIAPLLKGSTVIINKSTVPAGTSKEVTRIIKGIAPKASFEVVSNPEFLREGSAVSDFMNPDRIVIGANSAQAAQMVKNIYCKFWDDGKFVVTNPATSELIKYASNAFLATKISFINEIANLCEAVGGDVVDLAKGIGMDSRIGEKFLQPGPGYGGSCFPKDTAALLQIANEYCSPVRIVEATISTNSGQLARMVKKIIDATGGDIAGKIIGALGLTFKPNTDDLRDSPAISILSVLFDHGAVIQAHDPEGMKNAAELYPHFKYCACPESACTGADVVVLMTEWDQYRDLNFELLKNVSKGNSIFVDLRNVYEPGYVRQFGITYIGVGRN